MLVITPLSTSVTVEWGQVTDAVQYQIQYSTNADGSGSFSTSWVSEPTRTHNKTGLSVSTNYWVKVVPYNSANQPMTDKASVWEPFTTTA